MVIQTNLWTLTFNESCTALSGLKRGQCEWLAKQQPELFLLRARDRNGKAVCFTPREADVLIKDNTLTYRFDRLTVLIQVIAGDEITWQFKIENRSDLAMEFIDLPNVRFAGKLRDNGGSCAVVSTFNEGLLVTDSALKPSMVDPEYPSLGNYMVYPNMLAAPLMMWLCGDEGLLQYVKDPEFGLKGLDFACTQDSTDFRIRIFLGGGFGSDIVRPIQVVWSHFLGDWQDGAQIYRRYAETVLAARPLEDLALPQWYKEDMPLVITYPVRGRFDRDQMEPNKLFPYENILPYVDAFAERMGCRIMVLLMHWEGTAPWAPPYVWPPFGGEASFQALLEQLHAKGHLLGVYCSGYGFTEQSRLIETYNCSELIRARKLDSGFCRAPDQTLPHSKICTGQRLGYDLCPASQTGRSVINEALRPLLTSGVDYIQALDQNHGGGMYLCYGQDHGHPPVPGSWMTEASRSLLEQWRQLCPDTLLGCESAAAEPFLDALRLSDNRYELCYEMGRPIPVYAFLYHRYLHNFMGNQVSCPIGYTTAGLCLRIAYAFAAGDLITLVLNDCAQIMYHWGMRDFSQMPNQDTVLDFCGALQKWYRIYPALFLSAQMEKPVYYDCEDEDIPMRNGSVRREKAVCSTAWHTEGKFVQLFVNYTNRPIAVRLEQPAMWRDTKTYYGQRKQFEIQPHCAAAIEVESL